MKMTSFNMPQANNEENIYVNMQPEENLRQHVQLRRSTRPTSRPQRYGLNIVRIIFSTRKDDTKIIREKNSRTNQSTDIVSQETNSASNSNTNINASTVSNTDKKQIDAVSQLLKNLCKTT